MQTTEITGNHIRSQLAQVMGVSMGFLQSGMDKEHAAAAKSVCTAANSITANLRAELEHRKQNIAAGWEVSEGVGDMKMAGQ